MNPAPLPIDSVLPDLRLALQKNHNVILSAEPGAGKTTRVPPALLNEPWLAGKKIIMLEPRRLAAQRAAAYIAGSLDERTGETVGYRIRGESRIGQHTRLEIVTEGVLTRLLQSDPALPEVGVVLFDEFHERSIHADLGLALTIDVQEHLRPDLRILVMSATLDGLPLTAILKNAFVIKSEGRLFPVTTHYLERPRSGDTEQLVVSTIRKALADDTGDVLVFLPGQREIRRILTLLAESLQEIQESRQLKTNIHTLFGDAPAEQQQDALAPAPGGQRKVILSTSIAETSITIDGVRIVIDSGQTRSARFDPRRGMSGLVTTSVSQASADQRRGRAGRQAPGVCYRLWTLHDHQTLPPFSQPEILVADLAPLALEFAHWGTPGGEGLNFLDPPPAAHLSQAQELLVRLEAIDGRGSLTPHGRLLAELPVHPRFAHMLLRGKDLGVGALACDVAALLEERDILRGEAGRDIDLHSRWKTLRTRRSRESFALERVRAQASRMRNLIKVKDEGSKEEKLGVLLALAYPERVAKRRDANGEKYQLSGGPGAVLPKGSILAREQYLAVGDVDGAGNEVKLFLAEPISEDDIRQAFADQIATDDEVAWDARELSVTARTVTRFGAIVLSGRAFTPPSDIVRTIMLSAIREMGMNILPWTPMGRLVQSRSEWLRKAGAVDADWPVLSEEHLEATLDEWLGPYLDGISRASHLARLDLTKIIDARFSYDQRRRLDQLAPTHLIAPTGSRIPVDYTQGSQPVLAVRLQEMFGQTQTPTVCGGKVNVLLHLLSPAYRPLAVTQDLPSFWKNAYPGVRKDMRGRYPRHDWPENPLEAKPTRRAKKR